MKFGILGGTFNPIHTGHLKIASGVYNKFDVSRIIFIPVNQPPHKSADKFVEPHQRYEMIKEAIRGVDYFEVSDIEIKRKGKSYTIDTVQTLLQQYGADSEIYLIIGADSVSELNTWRDIVLLTKMCKFVVVNRPDYAIAGLENLTHVLAKDVILGIKSRMVEIPPVAASSTLIRKKLKNGENITDLTPKAVVDYIKENKLYV